MASTPEIIIAQICVNSPRMMLTGKTSHKNGLKPISRIRRIASADIGTIEASPQTKSKISAIQVTAEKWSTSAVKATESPDDNKNVVVRTRYMMRLIKKPHQ